MAKNQKTVKNQKMTKPGDGEKPKDNKGLRIMPGPEYYQGVWEQILDRQRDGKHM